MMTFYQSTHTHTHTPHHLTAVQQSAGKPIILVFIWIWPNICQNTARRRWRRASSSVPPRLWSLVLMLRMNSHRWQLLSCFPKSSCKVHQRLGRKFIWNCLRYQRDHDLHEDFDRIISTSKWGTINNYSGFLPDLNLFYKWGSWNILNTSHLIFLHPHCPPL